MIKVTFLQVAYRMRPMNVMCQWFVWPVNKKFECITTGTLQSSYNAVFFSNRVKIPSNAFFSEKSKNAKLCFWHCAFIFSLQYVDSFWNSSQINCNFKSYQHTAVKIWMQNAKKRVWHSVIIYAILKIFMKLFTWNRRVLHKRNRCNLLKRKRKSIFMPLKKMLKHRRLNQFIKWDKRLNSVFPHIDSSLE